MRKVTITPASQAASRANGKKSRGPVTPEGKSRSRRNALKHGLTASPLTLPRESQDNYIAILSALEAELKPQTGLESLLVESIAHARWRTLHIWVQEKAVLDLAMREAGAARSLPDVESSGLAFRNASDNSRVLLLIDRLESHYDRLFHRALRELHRLREMKDEQSNPGNSTKQTTVPLRNPGNPSPTGSDPQASHTQPGLGRFNSVYSVISVRNALPRPVRNAKSRTCYTDFMSVNGLARHRHGLHRHASRQRPVLS